MFEVKLQAASLSWRPPGGRLLFENLDLSVSTSEIVGITGGNGEGKTSLLRILAGIRRPDLGSVLLNGRNVHALPRLQAAKLVGYLPQTEECAFPVSAGKMVLFGRYAHMSGLRVWESGKDRMTAEAAMRTAGIYQLRGEACTHLSGGEMMRVRIARLLAQEPRVMLLDEPTTYLDEDFKELLARLLRECAREGACAVVVSHDIDFLNSMCGSIYRLQAGRLQINRGAWKENVR